VESAENPIHLSSHIAVIFEFWIFGLAIAGVVIVVIIVL